MTLDRSVVAGPDPAEPELAGPELAGPELAGPELAGPELAGPELVAAAGRVRTLTELAALLRRLRRRHARQRTDTPLTVRELASRSGYATGAISQYLSGKTLPPIDRFDVLIRLLGAGPAELRALATARDRVEEHRRAGSPAGPAGLTPAGPGGPS